MSWEEVAWKISLDKPPIVSHCGLAVHGRAPCERYFMKDHWCMHFYRYQGELVIDGKTFPIFPGAVSVVPPSTHLEYRYRGRDSVHLFAHLLLEAKSKGPSSIPAVQDMGSDAHEFSRRFEQAAAYRTTSPTRTNVRVWDLLWELASRKRSSTPLSGLIHHGVQKAVEIIELRLSSRLSVKSLAEEVGISHNHLTRLFQATFGKNVVQYIRNRRVQRAEHLLVRSTRSIKSIAYEVGIPDLHAFNKIIRHNLGAAPRDLRKILR